MQGQLVGKRSGVPATKCSQWGKGPGMGTQKSVKNNMGGQKKRDKASKQGRESDQGR